MQIKFHGYLCIRFCDVCCVKVKSGSVHTGFGQWWSVEKVTESPKDKYLKQIIRGNMNGRCEGIHLAKLQSLGLAASGQLLNHIVTITNDHKNVDKTVIPSNVLHLFWP